jgi:hypothetical protein
VLAAVIHTVAEVVLVNCRPRYPVIVVEIELGRSRLNLAAVVVLVDALAAVIHTVVVAVQEKLQTGVQARPCDSYSFSKPHE